MAKELLFSVTAKDCRWDFYRGSGKGGQKRNKTDSAVRCTHIDSGAVGNCEEHRSQLRNKMEAFRRMSATGIFKAWHKIETAKRLGLYDGLDAKVDKQLRQTKVEIIDPDTGNWTETI